MKASSTSGLGKNRRSSLKSDEKVNSDKRVKSLNPSRRHREKLNTVLDELSLLLPLDGTVKKKLDKLSVLKLTVSFFQTQNLVSGKRKTEPKDEGSGERIAKKSRIDVNVSEMALEAIGGFFIVLTEGGNVFYISENSSSYLGYSQAHMMHQDFLTYVHPDDVESFKECLGRPLPESVITHDVTSETATGLKQTCFCHIRCHAGKLSSHISPFYYKCFKFFGRTKPLSDKKSGPESYALFAVCTPMSKTASILKSIKESTKGYTCKLDLSFKNMRLDNRGLRNLHLTEKDINGLSAYFFYHPGDVEIMSLAHERIIAEGSSLSAFRAIDGKGHIVWVRGRASAVIGASGKLDGFLTENILLSEEEGKYYRKLYFRELKEWKNKSASCLEVSSEGGLSPCLPPGELGCLQICANSDGNLTITPVKTFLKHPTTSPVETSLPFSSPDWTSAGIAKGPHRNGTSSPSSSPDWTSKGIAKGPHRNGNSPHSTSLDWTCTGIANVPHRNVTSPPSSSPDWTSIGIAKVPHRNVTSPHSTSPDWTCTGNAKGPHRNGNSPHSTSPDWTCTGIANVPHRNVTSPPSSSPDWTSIGIAKVPHRNAASCSVVFNTAEDTKPSHHLRHWPQQSSGETRIANAICPANPSIPTSSYNPVIKGVGQSEMCNGQSNDMLRSWRTGPNGIHGFAPSTCSTAELPCIGVNGNISYGHPPCNDGIREWNTVPTIEASDPVDAYLSNFENLEQMINGLRSLLPPRAYEDEFEDDIKGSSRDHGMGLTTIENPPRKSGMFANVSNQQFGAGTLAELESIRLEDLKSLWNQGDSYKPEDNSGSVAFQTSPSPLPGQKDMFGPPWQDGPSFDPGLLNGGYTMREFSSQVRNLNNGFSGLSSPFDAANRS
ncbi:nuclear receptor coactivator 1 isoform X3 [Nematostella vectensis]|uniref:nuclear receptor coactivator 1 isoform X2 n=1 Tax=Nematostella vectensis TaxID=45351 RepID=UPI0020770BF8|nr:nuclear receptor coactivator 1 isoform X2 [Nematostella vectensis]XP_048575687.1 nuclear receptor coactivator 1 isoform X3 [Nematostella vectensis]